MEWKRRFRNHVLVATPLGRQVSHGHSGKHSKTTKPRALSVELIDFHVNSYLTGRRSPPQILTIPQASLSLPLPQAHGGMRCCERTCDPLCPLPPPRSQRLSLAAPALPCPGGKQRAPCPPRATATGHGRSSGCRLVYIALQQPKGTAHAVLTCTPGTGPVGPPRSGSPAPLRATGPAGQRGAGTVTRHHRGRGSPRSLCGRPGRKAGRGGGRAAPLTMSRADGAV